jgi:hypothetical protein
MVRVLGIVSLEIFRDTMKRVSEIDSYIFVSLALVFSYLRFIQPHIDEYHFNPNLRIFGIKYKDRMYHYSFRHFFGLAGFKYDDERNGTYYFKLQGVDVLGYSACRDNIKSLTSLSFRDIHDSISLVSPTDIKHCWSYVAKYHQFIERAY